MFRSKIITSDNYNKTKRIRMVLYAILNSSFFMLDYKGRTGLLKMLNLSELELPFGIIWFTSTVLLVIFYFYSRKTNVIGKLVLDEHSVTITDGKQETVYNLSQLSGIKITHNTYVGEDYKTQPMTNFKGNNYLEFDVPGKAYKIEFEIDSHYRNVQLKKVLDSWKKENVHYQYIEL